MTVVLNNTGKFLILSLFFLNQLEMIGYQIMALFGGFTPNS